MQLNWLLVCAAGDLPLVRVHRRASDQGGDPGGGGGRSSRGSRRGCARRSLAAARRRVTVRAAESSQQPSGQRTWLQRRWCGGICFSHACLPALPMLLRRRRSIAGARRRSLASNSRRASDALDAAVAAPAGIAMSDAGARGRGRLPRARSCEPGRAQTRRGGALEATRTNTTGPDVRGDRRARRSRHCGCGRAGGGGDGSTELTRCRLGQMAERASDETEALTLEESARRAKLRRSARSGTVPRLHRWHTGPDVRATHCLQARSWLAC